MCQNLKHKDKIVRVIQRIQFFLISMCMLSQPVLATGGKLDGMFGNILGLITKVFFYIGAVLLAWAIGQLVLAFKNEDADSKSRAVMVLVCAVMLMSINTIYNAITNGFGGVTVKEINI